MTCDSVATVVHFAATKVSLHLFLHIFGFGEGRQFFHLQSLLTSRLGILEVGNEVAIANITTVAAVTAPRISLCHRLNGISMAVPPGLGVAAPFMLIAVHIVLVVVDNGVFVGDP